jgi:FkbM family methyltransferase
MVARMAALADNGWWLLARLHAKLYGLIKDRYSLNLRGSGFVLRHLRRDRVFDACGLQWSFDHRIATTYARLIGGSYNEQDTHKFLQFVLRSGPERVVFIDVGSNIGEFLLDAASHPAVTHVIGFEPHPVCAEVCRSNVRLNGIEHVTLHEALVADGTLQPYVMDGGYAPLSGIRRGDRTVPRIPTIRLDDALREVSGPAVMLMDIEGAELDVMRGARTFIRQNRPLLIFEYNDGTREAFTLADVRLELGEDYELLRLRGDGYLDHDLAATWSCVAVHTDSDFADLCRQRLSTKPIPRWTASLAAR